VFLLRLFRIAMAAEELRLRHLIRRAMIRAILGVVALLLVFCALIFAHLAGWALLRRTMEPYEVALIFVGADLLGALLLIFLALRMPPSAVERDALAVRERALDEAAESLSVTAMVIRLMDMLVPARPRD
jgi:amino acid transporter